MLKFAITLWFLQGLTAREIPLLLNFVINKISAQNTNTPFLISLQDMTPLGNVSPRCEGSILTSEWIVTSAGCVSTISEDEETFFVSVGSSNNLDKNAERYRVSQIYIHPCYSDTKSTYDIGLIKLSKSLTFNENVRPIALPPSSLDVDSITSGETAGWSGSPVTILGMTPMKYSQKSSMKILSPEVCEQNYPDKFESATMFCAVANGFNVNQCAGDTGGPFYQTRGNKNFLIGITSFGSNPSCTKPIVYTRVQSYIEFITTTISGQKFSTNCNLVKRRIGIFDRIFGRTMSTPDGTTGYTPDGTFFTFERLKKKVFKMTTKDPCGFDCFVNDPQPTTLIKTDDPCGFDCFVNDPQEAISVKSADNCGFDCFVNDPQPD